MRFLLALLVLVGQAVLAQQRLYSYICMSAQDRLCLGLSTQTKPVYNPNELINLQVKVRDKVESKGLDYLKTRWSVFAESGRIQLANFTSLCVAKRAVLGAPPGDVILKPCGSQEIQQSFELSAFFDRSFNYSTLSLKALPDQCLTLMYCDRTRFEYCNFDTVAPYMGTTLDTEMLRGAYVKFMPCANLTSQLFTQTVDCAPGCSPFMMEGLDNVCDPECANDACNWDNGACATPHPTPPTFSPSKSPSRAPTFTPSTAPTTSVPTRNPTTTAPSQEPTTSSPSREPTTSSPSLEPTVAPSLPGITRAPVTQQPSSAPSSETTVIPPPSGSSVTISPSSAPSSFSNTLAPSASRSSPQGVASTDSNVGQSLWWVWLIICIIVVLLLLCIVCIVVPMLKKRRKNEQAAGAAAAAASAKGVDAPAATGATSVSDAPPAAAADPEAVDVTVIVKDGDDLAIADKQIDVEAQAPSMEETQLAQQ